ncbi:MAG: hypothetical protein RL662_124 [Bacteroidota bacterium]|jgi:NOL1/NOP2/sun family putative RNA methylase
MQLPKEFIDYTRPLLGDAWDTFTTALTSQSPVSIRINRSKFKISTLPYPCVPWCETGFYLRERPSFTFDPLFHAGVYYVQEASSMFIEQIFKQHVENEDVTVLDLCAAPGGKSTHIASLITKNSLLVCNEVIKSRANILDENITKAGYPNVIVTNSDPSNISKLNHFFDVILIDAPCSGEGMFRKDPESINEWSLANVKLCTERQQRIVADSWEALKPGGILIYSTCTYNKSENEDNIRWIKDRLGADVLPLHHQLEWNISQSYESDMSAYHFYPHTVDGEGFFVAALRKNQDFTTLSTSQNIKKNKKENKQKQNILAKEYKNYLIDSDSYTFFDKNDSWFAFPTVNFNKFIEVISALRLVSGGVYVGQFKGENFIPEHSLAMSSALNKGTFMQVDVNIQSAISFLKKEPLTLPETTAKGYVLVTYKGHPLGFVKNIGNRTNNLYPNEWRIRTTYLPKELDSFWE